MRRASRLIGIVAAAIACSSRDESRLVPGASVGAGKTAIEHFSCGACHEIRGVPGADGKIGPPLNGILQRTLIGGELPNSVANLVAWIRNPQAIEPRTAMPDLGVDDATARNIVAYLYSLH